MVGVIALLLVGALALVGLAVVMGLGIGNYLAPARRKRVRPDWQRLMVSTQYFQRVLHEIFEAEGFTVVRCVALTDVGERDPRELVFELHRGGDVFAALCGRWVIPITSEIVTRFQSALVVVKASGGMIVTTSYFSVSAVNRARQLGSLTLYDGAAVHGWIKQHWPA